MKVVCTHCGASLKAPESMHGKQALCPNCRGRLVVPTIDQEPADAPRPRAAEQSPQLDPVGKTPPPMPPTPPAPPSFPAAAQCSGERRRLNPWLITAGALGVFAIAVLAFMLGRAGSSPKSPDGFALGENGQQDIGRANGVVGNEIDAGVTTEDVAHQGNGRTSHEEQGTENVTRLGNADDNGHSTVGRRNTKANNGDVIPRKEPDTAKPSERREAAQEITNSIGMKLVLIPAGQFWMGSGESPESLQKEFGTKAEAFEKERPRHHVRITELFPLYMGTTEVTQGQWERVMGTRPWSGEDLVKRESECAATYVGWEDAVEFCRKLSTKEGRRYRLPTEAQWEYACRAGSTTQYGFGDNKLDLGTYAWFDENASDIGEKYAHRVGQKRPNTWGLYDMHGNVWEWCQDWYGEDYYSSSAVDDPSGPATGLRRVLRGGCWDERAMFCRSALRFRFWPEARKGRACYVGFRVVLFPGEQASERAEVGQRSSRSAKTSGPAVGDRVCNRGFLLSWHGRIVDVDGSRYKIRIHYCDRATSKTDYEVGRTYTFLDGEFKEMTHHSVDSLLKGLFPN